jgi:hypothetical protein
MGFKWVLSKNPEWDKMIKLLEECKEIIDIIMLALLTIEMV